MPRKPVTEHDVLVGQRIAALRKANRMSQTAMAKLIGVSFQQVQKYEAGKNRVGIERLRLIAEGLAVPLASLYGEHAPENAIPFNYLATPGSVEILQAYVSIDDPDSRALAVQLLKTMARTSHKKHTVVADLAAV